MELMKLVWFLIFFVLLLLAPIGLGAGLGKIETMTTNVNKRVGLAIVLGVILIGYVLALGKGYFYMMGV